MSMKILVVSDTHGNNTNLRKVISIMDGCIDMMIHLGDIQCSPGIIEKLVDCPVHIVRGNCDTYNLQSAKLIDIAGHRAFITHGHRYGGKLGISTMKEIAVGNGADIVMFGHTHEPLIEKYPDVTVINPGSLSRPRQEGHRPAYIVMTVNDDGSADYSLVYL